VNGVSPARIKSFTTKRLGLNAYLRRPGDGRQQPRIAAKWLLWAQLLGTILRQPAFHAIERLVRLGRRRVLGVASRFGDDTLAYFSERLDPGPTRNALVHVVRRAKRGKAFDGTRFIGLVIDGTGAARCTKNRCSLCHPVKNGKKKVVGYNHHFSTVAVVGTELTLPLDIEPYGPGDSEYAASQRLVKRIVSALGKQFADYVVADGEYATAPFLHVVGELGLNVVARLKGNLPELFNAARKRFESQSPHKVFHHKGDRVEVWDADDFDPWESLNWETVRVLRYRQHKPNGEIVEAYWLTDFSLRKVGSQALFSLCKSRWKIENEVFNDGKNRYGLEHLAHHHANSLLVGWLITCLAIVIERLYRVRYLHRGNHPVLSAADLLMRLWLALSADNASDTS